MIFFIGFSVLHVFFFSWVRYYWRKIPPLDSFRRKSGPSNLLLSVIIPVRNEASNIKNLLTDLERQSYSKDRFEVIIIDDQSDDGTVSEAQAALKELTLDYQIIVLETTSGKKEAITAGVNKAKGEVILTTDGDCRVDEHWLNTYGEAYSSDGQIMLTGPVKMDGKSFFHRMQGYEFAALIGVGAASLRSGNPGMCNGANLSYRKEAFLEVDGYEGNKHIPSGDDEFLLQKLHQRYPHKVRFLRDPKAVVTTSAKDSLLSLINQRIRWAGKWKFHKSPYIKLMAILIFFNYASVLYGFFMGLDSYYQFSLFVLIFIVRWIFTYSFARSVSSFLNRKKLFWVSLSVEIFYPLFVTFLGLASIFGKYSWKGRQYK